MPKRADLKNGSRPDRAATAGRALVLHPYLRAGARAQHHPAARLAEAESLAAAIGLELVAAEAIGVRRFLSSSLLGRGRVAEIGETVRGQAIDLVVIDATLSPVQQRTLEQHWGCKVIDRTGLILEIFGARARTREGTLQVELAALNYQRSRLVRSWTHLERQRGGFGFLGGPGESQLESDRRQIGARIHKLENELAAVRRTRALHRESRSRVPYPVVALVGYTNAGKSTLFNRLTDSDVFAKDLLFATLDPTMREVRLPSGRDIVLSDTVGFISELPTMLIAAFRATLEEVMEADLIVHVRDVAHAESERQAADVMAILAEIAPGQPIAENPLEALNKLDLVDGDARDRLHNLTARQAHAVPISALSGEGCEQLLAEIDERLSAGNEVLDVRIALADGAAIAWLYANGEVTKRRDADGFANIRVGLTPANAGRLRHRHRINAPASPD